MSDGGKQLSSALSEESGNSLDLQGTSGCVYHFITLYLKERSQFMVIMSLGREV